MSIKISINQEKRSNIKDLNTHKNRQNIKFKDVFAVQAQMGKPMNKQDGARMMVGQISSENPTVSHLLIKNDTLGSHCWDIIHNEINKNKPFTTIQTGTLIYINPDTMELSWDDPIKAGTSHMTKSAASNFNLPDEFMPLPAAYESSPQDLGLKMTDKIHAYLGEPYEKMDCYELLVKGLSDIGVKYHGENGLRNYLKRMAQEGDQGTYAYFNGEGIVKAIGDVKYSKMLNSGDNPKSDLESVLTEIKPLLKEGQILSFSTQKHGHTGIVSKIRGQWTYMNSGIIDHSLSASRVKKGVGQETLDDEIYNWMRLAQRHGENLFITLGEINEDKIAKFMPQKVQPRISQRS